MSERDPKEVTTTRCVRIPITGDNFAIVGEHFRQTMRGERLGERARTEAQRVLDGAARRKIDTNAGQSAAGADRDAPDRCADQRAPLR